MLDDNERTTITWRADSNRIIGLLSSLSDWYREKVPDYRRSDSEGVDSLSSAISKFSTFFEKVEKDQENYFSSFDWTECDSEEYPFFNTMHSTVELSANQILENYRTFLHKNFFTNCELSKNLVTCLTRIKKELEPVIKALFICKKDQDVATLIELYDGFERYKKQEIHAIQVNTKELAKRFALDYKLLCNLIKRRLPSDCDRDRLNEKFKLGIPQQIYREMNDYIESPQQSHATIWAMQTPVNDSVHRAIAEFTEEIKSLSQVPAPPVERKHISPDFVKAREWKKAHDEYQQWVAIQKEFSHQSYRLAERRTEQTKAVDKSLAQVCKLADERCQKLMGLTSGETPHETGSQDTDESSQLAEAIGKLKSSIDDWKQERRQKKWYDYILLFFNCCAGKKASSRYIDVTRLRKKVENTAPGVNEEGSGNKNNLTQ